MDDRVFTKLEYDKILHTLTEFTYFISWEELKTLAKPQGDLNVVTQLLDQTAEAMELLRWSEPSFMSGLKITEEQLAKARMGSILTSAQLYQVYKLLRASRLAQKYVSGNKYLELQRLLTDLCPDPALEKDLEKALDEEGGIRDDASPLLKSCRSQINTLRIRIRQYLQNFIRSSDNQKKLQDSVVTERDGRYVVPVKQEYRQEVKGVIHDESASGATVFIEPLAVVEQNNRIRQLQLEERREIERILRHLSGLVAVKAKELQDNLRLLLHLDYVIARAHLAYHMDAYRPEVNDRGIVDLERARHPLLGKIAVPINIELGLMFDVMVITGPNTGGKTVALKTLGLLSLMAMAGMFIPAQERSRISIFDRIHVDIGDEQSIEQSLSTFSSHMSNIIDILNRADDKSLVLIDELGAGTDPVEGAALARVILEELLRKKSRAIVTTHQSELKNFAYQQERVQNACVEFDSVTLQPTYRLTVGMPGQSNAFAIAARLGLSSELVDKARQAVPEREAEIGHMLRELKERSNNYEMLINKLEVQRNELEYIRQTLELEREQNRQEHEKLITKSKREAADYLNTIKVEADKAVAELKELIKDKNNPPKWHEVEQARKKLKAVKSELLPASDDDEQSFKTFKPGDYVYIKNVAQKGYVLSSPNQQGEVAVQAGVIKFSVKQNQLQAAQEPEESKNRQRHQAFLEKAKTISKEIDVRGKLGDEATEEVDKYLENAVLAGLNSVHIIHGKGTGALRKILQGYLQGHPYVISIRDGSLNEGGHGVTVVELR